MKRIICYGDSNTYGHNPLDGSRLPEDGRWSGILSLRLGAGYRVLEEGLCGRTTVLEDPVCEGRNGLTYLGPCLESHSPLDLVILMLGTNDLQCVHRAIPQTVAEGMARLVDRVRTTCPGGTRLLLVSPILIGDTSPHPLFRDLFPVGEADVKSRGLAPLYRELAQNRGCLFLDAAATASPSPLDGLHMDAAQHARLAAAIADRVRAAL